MKIRYPFGLLSLKRAHKEFSSCGAQLMHAGDMLNKHITKLIALKNEIASAQQKNSEVCLELDALRADAQDDSRAHEEVRASELRVAILDADLKSGQIDCDAMLAETQEWQASLVRHTTSLVAVGTVLNRVGDMVLASDKFMRWTKYAIAFAAGAMPVPTIHQSGWVGILCDLLLRTSLSFIGGVVFEAVWLNYLHRLAQTPPEAMTPPGLDSADILETLFTDKTRAMVFQPAIEDENVTWQKAMDEGRYLFADWIRIRANFILLKVALVYVKTEIIDKLRWR